MSTKNEGAASIQRFGMVTGIKPDKIDYYKELHGNPWPDVKKKIKECNISNYSIYIKKIENSYFLFSYFEYTGIDFAADMAKMAADPTTQKWWAVMEPMQQPVENRQPGEWWASMEEVFHLD